MTADPQVAPLPYLAPSEWQIFCLLSKRSPLTVRDLGAELRRRQSPRQHTTILTFVQRLVRKGYVAQRPAGGATTANLYYAVVPFELALRLHVERFLAELVLDDPEDLRLLRRILDEHLAAPAARR
ncbi:MAG TPA: BlaI/MecI/CopY family transcriptional regulator [Thermoanaerobaculia bacterium]|jgi:predicted transcriptional regulator